MRTSRLIKISLLVLSSIACFFVGTEVLAAASGGVGAVAGRALSNLPNIAKLITAGAYVAGMGFAVAAIAKFKAHKDNPTQVPISMPIVLLFVAAALIFIPSVFKTAGSTLFTTAQQGGISGLASF
jgi:intracellular multiplication protein IcmD